MSNEPIGDRHVVAEIYESVVAGDLEGLRRHMTVDTLFIEPDSLPYGGTYRGFDGFLQLVERITKVWSGFAIKLVKLIADDGYVVALISVSGKINARAFEMDVTEVWKLRDGKVESNHIYYFDTKRLMDAIAAAA
jgi:ketosteroid isomerase-like protein